MPLTLTVTVNNKALKDLYAGLLELVVEEDHRLAAICIIKLSLEKDDNGLWSYVDDDEMELWKPVKVSVGVNDENVDLFLGYITQFVTHIDPDADSSYLEIRCMDATCLMSLEEKIKAWPGMKDSDIARIILSKYVIPAGVDATEVEHDVELITVMQRETDIQFLKRLALRNGFECFVKGSKGYFRKPVLTGTPLPTLAAYFGDQTNLTSFKGKVDALRPTTAVDMTQIDVVAKEVQTADVTKSDQRKLGSKGPGTLTVPKGVEAKMFVKHAVATNTTEMKTLSGAMLNEGQWFMEGQGEVDTSMYGAVLQARSLVPIKGVGEMFSGIYYLTNIRHVITPERYLQFFNARRNAMSPASPLDFMGGGLFGGI